ncbi:hypothetical protein [Acinetobacter gerneri]|uniref:hypothetical protein n=1 Tax=Acinetobacter gerneri TaxID=202952 RepID=UPI0032121F78
MLKKILFVTLLFTCNHTFAAENVVGRKIVDIGCHVDTGVCYVALSGEAFGKNEKCTVSPSNEFRFDASTVNGKRTYASLYGAFLSKKLVDVYISGCYVGFLTLAFYHVK